MIFRRVLSPPQVISFHITRSPLVIIIRKSISIEFASGRAFSADRLYHHQCAASSRNEPMVAGRNLSRSVFARSRRRDNAVLLWESRAAGGVDLRLTISHGRTAVQLVRIDTGRQPRAFQQQARISRRSSHRVGRRLAMTAQECRLSSEVAFSCATHFSILSFSFIEAYFAGRSRL